MADSFPTKLADLNFRDDTVSSQSLYRSIRDLRRATLSIPHRLHSIVQDADFVQQVVNELSRNGSTLALVANERCGSWYIPPDRKAGSAYFKSTDGHFGQWDFSLRRLNLLVLSLVGKHGGAVIVDSTRRGKSMPDAFTKTVPIWVTVMNRVLFPDMLESHAFQRPPDLYGLGDSEVSQIESRLEGFVRALKNLELDVEKLRHDVGKPMKVFWRANDPQRLNGALGHGSRIESAQRNHHPIILCSASRRVLGAEMSEGSYIQGAGDDSEGWSRCLTPALFWQHKDELLNTPESELESLIRKLLVNVQKDEKTAAAVRIAPTSNLYIAKATGGDSGIPVQAEQSVEKKSTEAPRKRVLRQDTEMEFDLVINCNEADASMPAEARLDLACRLGKLGSRDLRTKLGLVMNSVQIRLKRDPGALILVTCNTGTDLCVGVALMLLCLFYDDAGGAMRKPDAQICPEAEANGKHDGTALAKTKDKPFIRRRLAWVISSSPDANPSRTTLQSINAFLIERPS